MRRSFLPNGRRPEWDGLLNQRMSDNGELYWTGHLFGPVMHYDSSLYSRKNLLGIKMIRNLFHNVLLFKQVLFPISRQHMGGH